MTDQLSNVGVRTFSAMAENVRSYVDELNDLSPLMQGIDRVEKKIDGLGTAEAVVETRYIIIDTASIPAESTVIDAGTSHEDLSQTDLEQIIEELPVFDFWQHPRETIVND